MELTPEQEIFRAVVRDFAFDQVRPNAGRWHHERTFPLDTIRAMGDLGLFGLLLPQEYGGGGGDLTTLCIAVEELARWDQSVAITLEAAVTLGATPIYRFGTENQRQQLLPEMCSGHAIGAFALTEPDAGSDASSLQTTGTASPDGRTWTINGSKAYTTNSGTPITSTIVVAARTGAGELSNIIVPAGTPGLQVQPAYQKVGWHASDTHPLSFDDCVVPFENILGTRGRGMAQFLETLDAGRIAIGAASCGVIRCCLEEASAYARERVAFGRPIGSNQAVAFACADLAVAYETSRMLTYTAAALHDRGLPCTQAAAMAKLHSSEAAVEATRVATQIFGGAGFMEESVVARQYCDAKVLEIGEGTSEIQRLVICRGLSLPV